MNFIKKLFITNVTLLDQTSEFVTVNKLEIAKAEKRNGFPLTITENVS